MAIDVHIDKAADVTTFTVKGHTEFEAFMAEFKAFYDNPPTTNIIWDLEQASVWDLTLSQIERLANYAPRIQKSRPGDKTAIVASDAMTVALSQLIIQHGVDKNIKRKVRIFNSLDNALAWVKGNLRISAKQIPAGERLSAKRI